MLYAGKILLSGDAFAERVSASLEDPRVIEFVALRIASVMIAQQPDLTAFRPTLGEMVASGGRLVVLGEYDVGNVPWYHLAWEGLVAETPYTFHTPEDFSCNANRGTPRGVGGAPGHDRSGSGESALVVPRAHRFAHPTSAPT